MNYSQDRVIILRQYRLLNEGDLLLSAINREGARMSFFAPAARKSRKRFGGGILEPTHFVSVVYEEKKDQEGRPRRMLKEAQLLEDFPGLRQNYTRLQAALDLLKTVEVGSREGEIHDQEIFNLLGNALRRLESMQTGADLRRLRLHFHMKWLAAHGVYAPCYGGDYFSSEEVRVLERPIAESHLIIPDDREFEEIQRRVERVFKEFTEQMG